MYYIGFDIGSSSVKAALVEIDSGKSIGLVHEPEKEMGMLSLEKGWAEQDPNEWWLHVCNATKRLLAETDISAENIKGIGIAYQMHGLVLVDENGDPLRKSIIWCDSRAVTIGEKAFSDIGSQKCEEHLLNSPANFTASKLKWVRDHEAGIYKNAYKMMLPGDYIAYKLSGVINTTKSGLSEGILWDFKENSPAEWLLDHYNINTSLLPDIVDTFSEQCLVSKEGSLETGLTIGTPIFYRAGDQPNNALSLNVLNPGEVAATGGTSGVVYAVTDKVSGKESTRINNFAHVNYTNSNPTIGKLLNINGAGIQFRWLKETLNIDSYNTMNQLASEVPIGAEGLMIIPFGNGAERMLNNKIVGTHFSNLDLNRHHKGHLCRATLEGIAFSFMYGIEILKSDHTDVNVLRVGNDNLFQSELFAKTIATLINQDIEVYNTTGAIGAARACSLHDNDFTLFGKRIMENDYLMSYQPEKDREPYLKAYALWKNNLQNILNHI